jgi:hypothetical protein
MLFKETVAVYCENHTENTNTVKPVLNGISRVQNIFPLKPGFRLIKVYYDSHGTWKYFLLRQNSVLIKGPFKTGFTVYTNSVRTSQETHYVSTTEPNRLMLFSETVAVYCENHMEHTNTLCGQNAEFYNIYKFSSYLTGNT